VVLKVLDEVLRGGDVLELVVLPVGEWIKRLSIRKPQPTLAYHT
tara:strand:- start:427 stop:558 length:132 start_codon:yes stop_codon:yes gene_type:complete